MPATAGRWCPLWVQLLGAIGLIISLAMHAWVMTANTFLSTFVRIQEERGHTTVSSGPYRYIRHPMYFGMLFMSWAMPSVAWFLVGVDPGGDQHPAVLHPHRRWRTGPCRPSCPVTANTP